MSLKGHVRLAAVSRKLQWSVRDISLVPRADIVR